jgi:phage protein D
MATYKTYAPEFAVRLDGQLLPAALKGAVSSVSYQDGMQGSDRVELTIANPALRWLDHPLLRVDTPFSLSIGYAPDPLEEVFVGEITGVEPSFPAGGMPTIRITAQDFLHRLTQGKTDKAFNIGIPSIGNYPLPDVAVASLVAAKNLLIPDPDPVGAALSVLVAVATAAAASDPSSAQKGVKSHERKSDFDILSTIAKENGWDVFIDHTQSPKGRVLKFQFLVQQYTPSLSLAWGESLIEFTPRLTTVGDTPAVKTSSWVDTLQTELMLVASWDFDRACFNLAVFPKSMSEVAEAATEAKGKAVHVKSSSYAVAARNILAEYLPRLNNRLTGSGSCIGNPEIKASRVIRLDNLGAEFSGSWRVTQATHTFDASGYRTSFQARKEVWFGSLPLPKLGRVVNVAGQFSV